MRRGGDAAGELVFTTGMTGYNETLTDPSYAGQIIVQTFPLIGNCGKISPDFEGKSAARGYVVREMCDFPSNFRSEGRLDRFLSDNGIPSMIYYPRGLHQQEAYKWMDLPDEWYPNTMEATNRVLSLPMHPYMKEEMVDEVVSAMIGGK